MSPTLDDALSLLREVEWAGCDGETYGGCTCACPVCGGERPWTQHFPAKRVDAYTRTEARDVLVGGHKPECKLDAILRSTSGLPK